MTAQEYYAIKMLILVALNSITKGVQYNAMQCEGETEI